MLTGEVVYMLVLTGVVMGLVCGLPIFLGILLVLPAYRRKQELWRRNMRDYWRLRDLED
jgi:hypothetical protein